jgi:hypothetical protein
VIQAGKDLLGECYVTTPHQTYIRCGRSLPGAGGTRASGSPRKCAAVPSDPLERGFRFQRNPLRLYAHGSPGNLKLMGVVSRGTIVLEENRPGAYIFLRFAAICTPLQAVKRSPTERTHPASRDRAETIRVDSIANTAEDEREPVIAYLKDLEAIADRTRPSVSRRNCVSGWRSSPYRCTRTRRDSSSLAAMRRKTGRIVAWASRRRSPFWASRTSAAGLGRGASC